ncbi:hypothetical protein [Actinacidiphila sp. ITFR-21]|uniref:hypothetical protein n=1 Tax=Actinacidiphila sp. ITFR-21 TaxID=3075199 RepID=UPI002889DA4B|nr:hypothetical protein [Streptomyces sp. ITFR-21]WNI18837.1 hypothetical protein RLT57_27130 [Streptomyces sp. ITFR-21]
MVDLGRRPPQPCRGTGFGGPATGRRTRRPGGDPTGAADGPDRFWELLDKAPPGWLLVFDNADTLEVLAGPRRDADQKTWGWHARVVYLRPLDPADAALVLRDLAPGAGDGAKARALAQDLGGLPLALHLAGMYLRSTVVRRSTFAAYGEALAGGGLHLLDEPGAPTGHS